MKIFRASLVVVLSLCVLLLTLLFLQNASQIALVDAQGVSAAEYKPPVHQELSLNHNRFASGGDIAADKNAIVVVWTESQDQQGGQSSIEMKFKVGNGAWLHRSVWSYADEGQQGANPAVVLDDRGSYSVAHIVWVDQNSNIHYLGWRLDLTKGPFGVCHRDPTEFYPSNCRQVASAANGKSRSRPQVAADGDGIPHVVWVEEDASGDKHIYYANPRDGGTWRTTSNPISTLGSLPSNLKSSHPVIAADKNHVYVAWVADDYRTTACSFDKSGIYFRRRESITSKPDATTWTPSGAKQLSNPPGGTGCTPELDAWPTIDVVDGKVFVLWQHQDGDPYNAGWYKIYTFTMNYRVLYGNDVAVDWSPSPTATDAAATLPFSPHSAFKDSDKNQETTLDYSGIRPAIQVVKSGAVITSYVAWHSWTPIGSSGGSGGSGGPKLGVARSSIINPQADVDQVTNDNPYQVFYATAGYANLQTLAATWGDPITVPVRTGDRVHCWPDLAVATYGSGGTTTHYPHFTLLKRPSATSGLKNVWYTNTDISFEVYLPVTMMRAK